MRLNSLSLSMIASLWAAIFGASSRSRPWIVSFVFEPDITENTVRTRLSSWPERSMATMVLSNVAAFGLLAMALISARWAAMPAVKAGA
ncbi:hypothetical protein D3C72_2195760 [compost metagenome]